jgi:hypothetical protein
MKTKTNTLAYILILFIASGFFLSLINFSNNRSLWLDEASLALNIVNKSTNELFVPLDNNQVAPIGFLMIEKAFSKLGKGTDWSLRLFPMISFFISVLLVYPLSLRVIREKNFALFATAFYGLSYYAISYSSEVKQYMTDVLTCLIILLFTINFDKNKSSKNQLLTYSLTGVIAIWFSNISIILLFSAGIYILHRVKKRTLRYVDASIILSSWLTSFAIYYVLFIHNHPTQPSMISYWSKAGAFLPSNVFSADFCSAMYHKAVALFGLLGIKTLSLFAVPFFCSGLLFLAKKDKSILHLLTLPIALHLALSYFKVYPFDLRLILYLLPVLVIIITSGFYYLFTLLKIEKRRSFHYLLTIPLIFNLILLNARGFPIEKEEVKKSLKHLNDNISKGDNIYVYYATSRAFSFYKREFPRVFKTDNKNIIVSKSSRNDWSQYEEDISNIKNPVWVLFSHVYRGKGQDGFKSEEDYILDLFESNYFQITDNYIYKGSSIYKAVPKSPIINTLRK